MKKSVPAGKSCLYLLCLLGLLLAIPPAASAAIKDWSSTATSSSWTLAGNWLGGVPADSLVTDIVRFNQTSYAFQPAAPNARKINGLIIGDGTTATASLTNTTGVQVSRLAVGSGGIVMNANSGPVVIGLQTLNSGINLGANQSWANNSSSLLTVHQIGNINDADNTSRLNCFSVPARWGRGFRFGLGGGVKGGRHSKSVVPLAFLFRVERGDMGTIWQIGMFRHLAPLA